MVFLINDLLDKMLVELKIFNPQYYRELDDPRIDTYYISINQHYYIVLYGVCEECDDIAIINNNNIKYNIMTAHGLENYVKHNYNCDNETGNIIFELELDTFNGNMDDLIIFLTNSIKKFIPF